MDEITVNLTPLYNHIRHMRKNDVAYVVVRISPPDEIDGESFPASLDLTGICSAEPDHGIEYDPIDAVEVPMPSGFISSNME